MRRCRASERLAYRDHPASVEDTAIDHEFSRYRYGPKIPLLRYASTSTTPSPGPVVDEGLRQCVFRYESQDVKGLSGECRQFVHLLTLSTSVKRHASTLTKEIAEDIESGRIRSDIFRRQCG